MLKVTNIAPGPRGVNTPGGPVMLRQGETVEVEMTDAEIASSKGTGWFTFEGQSAKETDAAYDRLSDDELRALLKDKGVQADGRWGHDKLVVETKKAMGA